MDPKKYIDALTNTISTDRHRLFRWLAGQGEETRIEAYRLQADMIKQNWSKYDPNLKAEFYYAMTVAALAMMDWTERAQTQKKRLTPEKLKLITETRIQRVKAKRKTKSAPKRDQIRVQFFEEICDLRSKGLSWREIADYIATYHNQKVSFGHLRECYLEFSEQRHGGSVNDNNSQGDEQQ